MIALQTIYCSQNNAKLLYSNNNNTSGNNVDQTLLLN